MEFLRSFLRRYFAGKPLVASRNVVCFLISDFVTEMSDLFLAILKKVSLSYALTTLISFHEQNGLNCAWKFTAVIATTQKVAVVSPLCSSLPSGSLAGFTLHRENCEFRHAMGTRIVYTSPLRKCQKS